MRSKKTIVRRKRVDVSSLNDMQLLFVKELTANRALSPSQAAKNAGYKKPYQAAAQLLKNPIVKKALGKDLGDKIQKIDLRAERVLQELMDIGFADPGELFDKDGNLLPIPKMPESVRRALSGFDVETTTVHSRDGEEETTYTTVKPRFWSKPQALELLGKYLKMFVEMTKNETGLNPETANLINHLVQRVGERKNVIDAKFISDQSQVIDGVVVKDG